MAMEIDVIAALGGPTIKESQQRVDGMINLYAELSTGEITPQMVVTGAFWAFGSNGNLSSVTIGKGMFDYAVGDRGMLEGDITVLDKSLDTIGDALAVKGFMRERGMKSLGLVTTDTHLARASSAFGHVLGPGYDLHPVSSGSFPGRRAQAVYEWAGGLLSHAVLSGTDPGDDEAIMAHLFALVPGYSEANRKEIASNHIRRVLGLPLVRFESAQQY